MSKTRLLYNDVAPGAENDATVSTSDALPFSDLQNAVHGTDTEPIISLELNQWMLDGTHELQENHDLAFWSGQVADADGTFAAAPVITITTGQQYSSVGISINFGGDAWATAVNVKWYRGNTLLENADFAPDALSYFLNKNVQAYNKIVFTFSSMSLPHRRLKIDHIIFGLNRVFGMTELRGARIVNQIGLISEELPISTLSWTLDSKTDVDYMFQLKQPVEAWNADTLLGVYYIDEYSRKADAIFDISCYDAIGVLSENVFTGGVYSAKSAKALVSEIIGGAFDVAYADDVADASLTGVIEDGTKRDALQQVFFAWGVCAATDGLNGIRIFNLPSSGAAVGVENVFNGVTVDTSAIVTQVIVYAHTYAQDANGGIEINGVKYSDTKTAYTVNNPSVTATDKQNVVKVDAATLVSPSIGQAVAQRVYDFYTRRNTERAKIVWSVERLGDYATLPNNWDGTESGNIAKMDVRLSNTVVADIELR